MRSGVLSVYKTANWAVIIVVVLYSIICLMADSWCKPVAGCVHAELLGKRCPVCNTARGIQCIEHGQFNEARKLQSNSFRVFFFMMVQLFIRGVVLFLLKKGVPLRRVLQADIFVMLVLVFTVFASYLGQTSYIFYKMLLTGR